MHYVLSWLNVETANSDLSNGEGINHVNNFKNLFLFIYLQKNMSTKLLSKLYDLFLFIVCYPSAMDNILGPAGSRCVDILAEKVRWGLVVRKVGSGGWLRTGVWRSNLRWLCGGRYCRGGGGTVTAHLAAATQQQEDKRWL